jgi:hypothetical protein
MNNSDFLQTLKNSFISYIENGERSNKKLKILHAKIASDLKEILNDDKYEIYSLNLNDGKEKKISGRYIDKTVDIAIFHNDNPVAGIAVKYVMSNYLQNSNNYFENMLGETANIRCVNIPYFQIFIIPEKIPYYNKDGKISKWEEISGDNLKKYTKLSNDNVNCYMHTPNKTLILVININDNIQQTFNCRTEYEEYHKNSDNFELKFSEKQFNCKFGNAVIYNNYEEFIKKVAYFIKSI